MSEPTAEEQVYAAIAAIEQNDLQEGEMVAHGVIVYAYVANEDADGDLVLGVRMLATKMSDWMLKGLLREGVAMVEDSQPEWFQENNNDE